MRILTNRVLVVCFFLVVLAGGRTASRAFAQPIALYFPFVSVNFSTEPGTAAGIVVDASQVNTPLEGAHVCYESVCATTDDTGYYSLDPVPYGAQVLTASANAFNDQTVDVFISGSLENEVNFALSPLVGDFYMRFVVTWSAVQTWPNLYNNDLDALMWLETPNTTVYVDPSSPDDTYCVGFPYICHEVDVTNGSGPETIAILQPEPNGEYYFGVLNYNQVYLGTPPITQTDAHLRVYDQNGLVVEMDVPTDGIGDFWYALKIDATGAISQTNCIINLPDAQTTPDCP